MDRHKQMDLDRLINILIAGNRELDVGKAIHKTMQCISGPFSDDLDRLRRDSDFMEKVFPRLERFCEEVTRAKTQLPHGYSIKFEPKFKYERPNSGHGTTTIFGGLYLILRNSEGELVGQLKFRVGYPFEILEVQGRATPEKRGSSYYKGDPDLFFQKTGQHFDETLIDAFLGLVNKHLDFQSSPRNPKVVFSSDLFSKMRDKDGNPILNRRKRIAQKYLPRSEVPAAVTPSVREYYGTHRVRENLFSRRRQRAKRPRA